MIDNGQRVLLKEQRDSAWNSAKATVDDATAQHRDLSVPEQRAFDSALADIASLDARIDRLGGEERRSADVASTFDRIASGPTERNLGGNASDCWLPGLSEYRQMQTEQRAIGTTGAFIAVAASKTFADQVRRRTAVLAAGPTLLPVEAAGSLRVPAVSASVSVSSVAENTAITASDPTLSSVLLDPKKIAALTLVAREAVEDSSPELRVVVGNSLVRDLAVELDRQLVAGDGTGANMTGLLNQAGVTAGPSQGTNGAALSYAALADSLGAYEAANLDPDRAAWLFHARTWASVRKLVDSTGQPVFSVQPTGGMAGTLFGKPVYISNNVPINGVTGTSTDCSSILLADFSMVMVGVARQVELKLSEDYAFNTDQIALRVTARYDIGLPQPSAVVKVTGVRP